VRRAWFSIVLVSAMSLGCAGLFEEEKEDTEEKLDTAEEDWDDTASRKSAKQKKARRKKLAAMPKKATEGPITIKVKPGSAYNAAEISCTETGFRKRCNFNGNQCSMTGVPLDRGIGCRVFFQGAKRASWGPIKGNSSLSCSFSGTNATCTES